MKNNRVILVSLALLLSLTACANHAATSAGQTTTQGTSATATASTTATSTAASSTATSSAATDATTAMTQGTTGTTVQEPAKVRYVYPVDGRLPQDRLLVQTELNKLTVDQANVEIIFQPILTSQYGSQVSTMLASRADMDLMLTLPVSTLTFHSLAASHFLLDISSLAVHYAGGAMHAIAMANPGYMAGTTINSRLYGLTTLDDKVTSVFVAIRQDMLDKYGLDLAQVKSAVDLEAILATLFEKTSIPVLGSANSALVNSILVMDLEDFGQAIPLDTFGDNQFCLGAVMGNGSTVVNFFASEQYQELVDLTYRWLQAGYIAPGPEEGRDATLRNTLRVAASEILGLIGEGATELELALDQACGHKMSVLKLGAGPVTSADVQKFTWVLPYTCDEPEAALKFLNLTYTEADVVNLIDYGILGKHYVEDENDANVIRLPEGVTPEDNQYGGMNPSLFGSEYLAKTWAGEPANLREMVLNNSQAAPISRLMGFVADASGIQSEKTLVRSVMSQYRPLLESGAVTSDQILPEFLAALALAGYPRILTEMQRQFDAFKK
jgi:putative aldouronate transport system substrate-binding protein